MGVGSIGTTVPPQISTALDSIAGTQAAELDVAMKLEQSLQSTAASLNPNLGQNLNLTV